MWEYTDLSIEHVIRMKKDLERAKTDIQNSIEFNNTNSCTLFRKLHIPGMKHTRHYQPGM